MEQEGTGERRRLNTGDTEWESFFKKGHTEWELLKNLVAVSRSITLNEKCFKTRHTEWFFLVPYLNLATVKGELYVLLLLLLETPSCVDSEVSHV